MKTGSECDLPDRRCGRGPRPGTPPRRASCSQSVHASWLFLVTASCRSSKASHAVRTLRKPSGREGRGSRWGLTTIVRIPRAHDNRPDIEAMRQAWDTRAQTNLLYSIDAQNRHWAVEDFYARGPELVAEFVDPVLEALGVDPAGLRVLEIGCGIGRLFAALAERFGEVWGTDISHTMIEYGQLHCPVSAIWLLGDGTSLHGIDDCSV